MSPSTDVRRENRVRNFHAASRIYALRERSRRDVMPRVNFLFLRSSILYFPRVGECTRYDVLRISTKVKCSAERSVVNRLMRRAFSGFYAWLFVVIVVAVESFLLKFNPIINLVSVDSSRAIAAFIVATASACLWIISSDFRARVLTNEGWQAHTAYRTVSNNVCFVSH